MKNHYLIHLPHCGTNIPKKYLDDYLLPKDELRENIYQYWDLYTDELFASLFDCFGGVKNSYSRVFVDSERFGDDSQENMYKNIGLGGSMKTPFFQKNLYEK